MDSGPGGSTDKNRISAGTQKDHSMSLLPALTAI